MRGSYLITYDIRDDKRLRRVYKTMRNWGDHLQYSVFECQLSDEELAQLRGDLGEIINHAHDQILIIYLGPAANRGERAIQAIGQPYIQVDSPCYIV
ncbi:MAG: CRISPR-associated endonuclease Cas2 [Phycisphaera sp. RhM]|nr:CRISPR-associated endonuclease Cas2 [Phycisphaera sp. RhM]